MQANKKKMSMKVLLHTIYVKQKLFEIDTMLFSTVINTIWYNYAETRQRRWWTTERKEEE